MVLEAQGSGGFWLILVDGQGVFLSGFRMFPGFLIFGVACFPDFMNYDLNTY